MSIEDAHIIDLPKIHDVRGNLSFVESGGHIPFDIKRSYWIYDVPGGQVRGGHAFKRQNEFIIALSGSFDVVITDGDNERTIQLNRSYYGLYVPKGIWRRMENFSTNSLAICLADTLYSPEDYIRDWDTFLKHKEG